MDAGEEKKVAEGADIQARIAAVHFLADMWEQTDVYCDAAKDPLVRQVTKALQEHVASLALVMRIALGDDAP